MDEQQTIHRKYLSQLGLKGYRLKPMELFRVVHALDVNLFSKFIMLHNNNNNNMLSFIRSMSVHVLCFSLGLNSFLDLIIAF